MHSNVAGLQSKESRDMQNGTAQASRKETGSSQHPVKHHPSPYEASSFALQGIILRPVK